MQIQSSKTIKPSHLKMLFWGLSGTRKTESILRYFPNVLMIDTEGNAEQCVTVPDIPEFLLAKTKDVNEVIRILDEVAAGKVKFPDGRQVETVAIDSSTVLWSVRKDARAIVAEGKAQRWGKTAEDATFTQLDWTMAKRPMQRMMTRLNNSPIKFLILTARESDEYVEDPTKKDVLKKIGVKPDMMKGIDYDVNLSLHFAGGRGGVDWSAEVTKVQGGLGSVLPVGKRLPKFPSDAILAYAGSVQPKAGQDAGEDETAEAQAEAEMTTETAQRKPATRAQESKPTTAPEATATVVPQPGQTKPTVTLDNLYAEAMTIGFVAPNGQADRQRIREILKAAGFDTFNAANYQKMLDALQAWAEKHEQPA